MHSAQLRLSTALLPRVVWQYSAFKQFTAWLAVWRGGQMLVAANVVFTSFCVRTQHERPQHPRVPFVILLDPLVCVAEQQIVSRLQAVRSPRAARRLGAVADAMKRFLCALPCVRRDAAMAEEQKTELSVQRTKPSEPVRNTRWVPANMQCKLLSPLKPMLHANRSCNSQLGPAFRSNRPPTHTAPTTDSPHLFRICLQAQETTDSPLRPRISHNSLDQAAEEPAQAHTKEHTKESTPKGGSGLREWWSAPAVSRQLPKPPPKVPELRVYPLEPGGPPVRVAVMVSHPAI